MWCVVCLLALLGGEVRAGVPEPLPDAQAFLEKTKQTLLSDQLLLSQYTYNLEQTERKLDKRGRVKKTTVSSYEVFPSLDPELHYQRLVARDGEPVPAKKLEKQDREHASKLAKRLEREGDGAREEQRRRKREEEDREWVDEAFRLLQLEMIGREEIDGRRAILFRFEPRPDYRVRVKAARHLKKVRGRLWVCEEDHQMIRLEVELMEPLKIGGGLVARLHRGTRLEFERRKVNDEIWLPSEAHVRGSGRLLLLKALRFDQTLAYSSYRKYNVETSWAGER